MAITKQMGPQQDVTWRLDAIEQMLRKVASLVASSVVAGTNVASFTVGDGNPGTPANGSTNYINTALNNKALTISVSGQGPISPTLFNAYPGGGFTLLTGLVFNTGETWVVLY